MEGCRLMKSIKDFILTSYSYLTSKINPYGLPLFFSFFIDEGKRLPFLLIAPSRRQIKAAKREFERVKKGFPYVSGIDKKIRNNKNTCILDIGANVGYTSLSYANRWPNAKIVCVEPYLPNLYYLMWNTRDKDNFICMPFGVGTRDGFSVIDSAISGVDSKEINTGLSSFTETNSLQDIRIQDVVSIRSVASLIATVRDRFDIAFIKVDIEGYDVSIARFIIEQYVQHSESVVVQFEVNPGLSDMDELHLLVEYLDENDIEYCLEDELAVSHGKTTDMFVNVRHK